MAVMRQKKEGKRKSYKTSTSKEHRRMEEECGPKMAVFMT
jgi:hypothetical protein